MSRVPSLRYPIAPLPAPYPWRRMLSNVLFVGVLIAIGAVVVAF
jgi:hypothetical protein